MKGGPELCNQADQNKALSWKLVGANQDTSRLRLMLTYLTLVKSLLHYDHFAMLKMLNYKVKYIRFNVNSNVNGKKITNYFLCCKNTPFVCCQ